MKSAFAFAFLVTVLLGSSLTASFLLSRAERSTNEACLQHPYTGRCLALIIRYYYNATDHTCNKFVYGGCDGNDNNFRTGEDCVAACGGTVVDSKDRDAPVFLEKPNDYICNLPSETGPCRGAMPRYYFSGEKCETFTYGGCGGNDNNFQTKEDCLEQCGHKIFDN